ncbi:MAG TPA: signal peptidase II [Longimicrobium sp.]|nr:signal peptidase II [Longimicrobium sp.]
MTSESRPVAAPGDETGRKAALYAGLVGGVIVLDQLTKWVVERSMRLYDPIPVMGDFFRLTFIYNRGAAFGIHAGEWSRWIFSVLAAVAVVVLFVMYRGTAWKDKLRLIAIAAVTGGAIGNLIDRVRSSRGVVDFLDLGFGDVRWPVFNIADIAVTLGALALAVSLWREEQAIEQELDVEQT